MFLAVSDCNMQVYKNLLKFWYDDNRALLIHLIVLPNYV